VNGIAQAATVLNRREPTRLFKPIAIKAGIEMSAGACNSFHNALKQLCFDFA
jgi:hypothetical protein